MAALEAATARWLARRSNRRVAIDQHRPTSRKPRSLTARATSRSFVRRIRVRLARVARTRTHPFRDRLGAHHQSAGAGLAEKISRRRSARRRVHQLEYRHRPMGARLAEPHREERRHNSSQRPTAEDVRSRVQKAARQFRANVKLLLGRALPDWWISAWNQAAFIADTLAETITTTEGWSHFATEWTLPSSAHPGLGFGGVRRARTRSICSSRGKQRRRRLPVSRSLDHRLQNRPAHQPCARRRNPRDRAVEDFRTKLLEGKGVQLAIYALALHALGAREVGAQPSHARAGARSPASQLPDRRSAAGNLGGIRAHQPKRRLRDARGIARRVSVSERLSARHARL